MSRTHTHQTQEDNPEPPIHPANYQKDQTERGRKSPTPLPPPHQLPLLPLPPPPHLLRNPHLHRPLLPLVTSTPITIPITKIRRTLTPPQPHKPSKPSPPFLQPLIPIPISIHPQHPYIASPSFLRIRIRIRILRGRGNKIPPPHNRIRIKKARGAGGALMVMVRQGVELGGC